MTGTPFASQERGRAPIHAALRARTADLHREVEARLDLLAPDLSLDRYRRTLALLLRFYAPLEVRLAQTLELPTWLPFRVRSPLLHADLVALGTPALTASAPMCDELPALPDAASAAGCFYVLEGSCLGGQVLARSMRKRFGLTRTTGCAFFVGDAERTAERWRATLRWLDQTAQAGADPERIVAAAQDTFRALARWAERRAVMR